jgi:P22_AR N-terminal domain
MTNQELELITKTVQIDNNFIYIKPICDYFEINYENQCRYIAKDTILKNWSTKKSNSLLFGDNYPRVLIGKNGFIRWIQQLNSNLVRKDLKDTLVTYQKNIFDFLYAAVENTTDNNKAIIQLYSKLDDLKLMRKDINSKIAHTLEEIKTISIHGLETKNEIPFPSQNILPD